MHPITKILYDVCNVVLNCILCSYRYVCPIKSIQGGNKYQIYLLFYCSLLFKNIFPNFYKQIVGQMKLSHSYLTCVHLSNGKLERRIIFHDKTSELIVNKLITHLKSPHLFDSNELMMARKPVFEIVIRDKHNNNVASLKDLLNKYADRSKYHNNNTLKNIFDIEGSPIKIDMNDSFHVVYLNAYKRCEKKYDAEIGLNMHVSDFFMC